MCIKVKRIYKICIPIVLILSLVTYIFYKKNYKNNHLSKTKQYLKLKNDGSIFFTTNKNKNYNHLITDNNSIITGNSQYLQVTDVLSKNNVFTNKKNKNNILYNFLVGDKLKKHIKNLNQYQRYCHFPISSYLTSKYKLTKCYKEYNKKYKDEYNFMVESYILPDEKEELKMNFKNSELWITKPYNKSRGRDVKIVNKINQISKKAVVSKYIKPHTLFGKKYDIRIICLVTSYDPLIIYLYTDGVLRFATHPYLTDKEFYIEDKFMHLTNNCINKDSIYYKRNENPNLLAESVASLKSFNDYCNKNKIDYDEIMRKIKDFVIKSILLDYDNNVKELKKYDIASSKNIFELFGVDVLLDENLEPHLLEINLNPSLNFNCKLSDILYEKIIVDTLNIIGIKPYNREKTKRIKLTFEENLRENIEELNRQRGGFELIFPLKNNINKYNKYIKNKTRLNNEIWNYIKNSDNT